MATTATVTMAPGTSAPPGPTITRSYLPPEGSGAAPDQGGYGGHDAGYGSGGYGNYPGYQTTGAGRAPTAGLTGRACQRRQCPVSPG